MSLNPQVESEGLMRKINFTDKRYAASIRYDLVNLQQEGWSKVSRFKTLRCKLTFYVSKDYCDRYFLYS